MLLDKYTPYTLTGIIGNVKAVARLRQVGLDLLGGVVSGPIMLTGPSGTGKTAAARALAYENGMEVLELNSGDYRDAETISKKVVPASQTRGLFNKRVVILFDEIDELAEKFDAGAERVILQLVEKSKQPLLFTANDFWDRKILFLRNRVERVEFRRVDAAELAAHLRSIAVKEGEAVPDATIAEIARRSNGDVRGAINDLEAMFGAKPELLESLSTRDRKLEIFAVLDKIFLSRSFDAARYAAADADVDLGMMINWVDENIPTRYASRESRSASYRRLARASSFYENGSRSGNYGYWRYSSVLLSSGVALSNTGNVSLLARYSFPARVQQLSKTKKSRKELDEIAARLSAIVHSSKRDIIRGTLPIIAAMVERAHDDLDKESIEAFMSSEMGLDKADLKVISEQCRYAQAL